MCSVSKRLPPRTKRVLTPTSTTAKNTMKNQARLVSRKGSRAKA